MRIEKLLKCLLLKIVMAILFAPFSQIFGDLNHILDNYEILPPGTVRKQVVKRGTNNNSPLNYNKILELSFSALSRDFRLFLTPKHGLLSKNFQAVLIDSKNKREEIIPMNPDEFYEGHVFGESMSHISAHLDDYGALTAHIKTKDDIYVFEPAWRHFKEASLGSSLAFKVSDLKNLNHNDGNGFKNRPFCSLHSEGRKMDHFSTDEIGEIFWRKKRQNFDDNFKKNRCPLKIVADHLFFENIGGSSQTTALRYLISLIDRVNTIFLKTIWRDSETDNKQIKNMGFIIKKIIIHKNADLKSDHYNNNNLSMPVSDLLSKFSEIEGTDYENYCLAHLFTYRAFQKGVLGLGYIAQAKMGTSGGICCAPVVSHSRQSNRLTFFNTAVSSLCSSYGKTIVTREADLVTAHEFGHNWGSQHDLATDECSPDASGGGPYVMNTFSVSGYDQNNKLFSPCSRRSIKAVLYAKSDLCFEEEQLSFCGNKRVEPGEDCDEDILGEDNGHPGCCAHGCKFKPGAVCSPKNSPCCTEKCQFETVDKICQKNDTESCKLEAVCDGHHAECPKPLPAPDGLLCLDDGECRNGECVTFCEKTGIDMKPCICENVTESCYRCCRPPNSTVCRPFLSLLYPDPQILDDGTRCIHGYCLKGSCKKHSQDFVEHLLAIIENWNAGYFFRFLADNIVGTIIVVTLIFWIPLSCYISSIDRKTEEEIRKQFEWRQGSGSIFVGSRDKLDLLRILQYSNSNYDDKTPPDTAL